MKLTPMMLWVLGFVLFFLSIRIWVGSGSYPEIWELEQRIQAQKDENQQLAERNRKLQADVTSITRDNDTIEDYARSELGMIKAGETFYQVILKNQPEAPLLAPLPASSSTTGVRVE
ncbi:FtsB family cell division protein [Thiofilum flexile]|uniref:FtsB family cell division protein n=1 Tax=Thiofilum flexile TaxID=125627 RepID=UPI0003783046|nr:septum formation initiator family protein [Thiofilum flexile]